MTSDPADPGARLRLFRAVIGCATLVMLGTSYPLWIAGGEIPRVPFVPAVPASGVAGSWLVFAALLMSVAVAAIGGLFVRAGSTWVRVLDGMAFVIGTVLVLEDQHRFQPWFYQFLIAALCMASGSVAKAIRWNRAFVIGIYVYSGLSKLDFSFTHELGPLFLQTLCRPFGVNPGTWSERVREAAVLAMPIGEIAVGLGLVFRKTRPAGVVGAVLLHLTLLAILGPWGLNHSLNVLIWNGALIAEVILLFHGESVQPGERPPLTILASMTRLVLLVALVMPLAERLGLWDVWPSFALYASHVERVDIYINVDELDGLPASLRPHVAKDGAWRRLDLTAWSRAERRTPVNPQARSCLGIAEGLAFWKKRPRLVLVRWFSRADPWTGRRESAEALGFPAIRRMGDRYRLNASPEVPPGIGDARQR